MAYNLGSGIWGSIFAVPCDVVDRHIKLCGPLSLKALMLILRSGGNTDTEHIAKALGQSVSDVRDAVNYWIESGILNASGAAADENEKPLKIAELVLAEEGAEGGRKTTILPEGRVRLTTQQINEMADKDSSIAYLLQETQQITGKPLTPVTSETIAALYSYYGMEPDIILMLVQYCASLGKDNMRYVEKMAATWMEKSIDTHEKAEEEILRLTRQNSIEGKICSFFGISGRALVSSEKKYIDVWINEWRMELPLIELAYERCIELKGKLSFAYINGILSNWQQKNIKTPAQAMGEINRGKQREEVKPSGASYDISELENMLSGDFTDTEKAL